MFDSFSEIIFYFNLFLWNDRRQSAKKQLTPSKVFTATGEFQEGMEAQFRSLCQDYVSFVRGENPYTFPYRIYPNDFSEEHTFNKIEYPSYQMNLKKHQIQKEE
jgi:hypothetical protein